MDDAWKATLAILPVPAYEHGRENGLAFEIGPREPACLRDVLGNSLGMRGAEVTGHEVPGEPELDVPTLGIDELFDIQEIGDADLESRLLPNFPRSCSGERFVTLNAAAWADPEIVLGRAMMPHEKEPLVVFNDGAGRNAV